MPHGLPALATIVALDSTLVLSATSSISELSFVSTISFVSCYEAEGGALLSILDININ